MKGDPGDRETRIRATLGQPGLSWLLDRAKGKLERGQPVAGRIVLRSPSEEQRLALRRLLGSEGRGASLAVDLGKLESVFRAAGLCERLEDAVELLLGPVADRRSQRKLLRTRWARVFAAAESKVLGRPVLERWLLGLRESGLIVRLARNDPEAAEGLLRSALRILDRLPADGVPLAELAADGTGDAHALDAGTPLGALVVRAAALLGGGTWNDSSERRDVWAAVGVACDDLSSHVLTLGLWADDESLTARALRLHAEAGVPYRLSLRQLGSEAVAFRVRRPGVPFLVSVCENPTVVAAAATRRGAACAQLVCTEGQPSMAVRILLDRLRAAGATLRYHGDFDWPGIRIANLVMERHGALPWRFGAEDYRAGPGGIPLAGARVEASWDPALAIAMAERGEAVHEEAVMSCLMADVGT